MLSQKNVMGMNAGSSISESRNALKGDNMSVKNVYAQIVSFENLLQAEKDAELERDMKMSSLHSGATWKIIYIRYPKNLNAIIIHQTYTIIFMCMSRNCGK